MNSNEIQKEILILKSEIESLKAQLRNVLEDSEREKDEIRAEYQYEINRLNRELLSKNDNK